MAPESAHLVKAHELWSHLKQRKKAGTYELNGHELEIADVVATAYHGTIPELSQDPEVLQALQDSVQVLFDHLARGWYVYGVNTGFGGSADTRTDEVIELQKSLMQLTQTGILETSRDGALPEHAMPPAWVRAFMVVRCNATMRGHSAVSYPIIKAITNLLQNQLTPVVPLRGSVSASGDLMPLAYVAGCIEGNPDVLLECNGKVRPSHEALRAARLAPVTLGPKEGLGLINGTAASAGLGALVIAEAHNLALLTQVLSGAAVEALNGSSESFHPFIANARPHPGQIECARNVHYFLRDSYLSRDVLAPKNRRREDLEQDRYALRSTPQWIGPQLEDLMLADQQIRIELNSSCDNPLVDSSVNDIYYGCNFQAASVTSAMEKVRLSLQMFGRLLFAQSTEMIDPHLSGGLPANLAADDPSLSFTMKGVDINMAAYMAELSYLANPMSSHVQTAEMHNQSVNSMALASARMSYNALDVLHKMVASSAYVCCQALDLRALHSKFIQRAIRVMQQSTQLILGFAMGEKNMAALMNDLESHVKPSWNSTSKLDLHVRCESLVTSAIPIVLAHFTGSTEQVSLWKIELTKLLIAAWDQTYAAFAAAPHTPELLGKGSRALYGFIRNDLGVPFHQGFIEHPTINSHRLGSRAKKTIGGWISIIHDSLKSGTIYDPIMQMVEDGLLSEVDYATNEHVQLNGTSKTDCSGTRKVNGINGYREQMKQFLSGGATIEANMNHELLAQALKGAA